MTGCLLIRGGGLPRVPCPPCCTALFWPANREGCQQSDGGKTGGYFFCEFVFAKIPKNNDSEKRDRQFKFSPPFFQSKNADVILHHPGREFGEKLSLFLQRKFISIFEKNPLDSRGVY